MKKSLKVLFGILTAAMLLNLTGCGSTDTEAAVDETIISTVEANHIRVDVTKSNVKITLTKSEDEDIEKIDVVETPFGSISSIPMTQNTVSFIWPFAEADKEYKLCAKIYGSNSVSEEYVTFKTTADMTSLISYSEDYEYSVISLIAKGNQRLLKIDASYDTINSVIRKANAENTKLLVSVYSGKHYKADAKDAKLIGTITHKFESAALNAYKNGMDIISQAGKFNISASQMNSELSAKQTYFAIVTVQFTLPNMPEGSVFTAKGIFSNDTIYTPVAKNDLPDEAELNAADAK